MAVKLIIKFYFLHIESFTIAVLPSPCLEKGTSALFSRPFSQEMVSELRTNNRQAGFNAHT